MNGSAPETQGDTYLDSYATFAEACAYGDIVGTPSTCRCRRCKFDVGAAEGGIVDG